MEFLHTHIEMIDLNPLVEERHPIKPPAKATPEEYHCVWYSLTDKIQYLPGGLASGSVTYSACFHDLHNGIQTHVYAPMGLDIKNKWTVNGSEPGEPTQPAEIGKGIPLSGLYLREDCDFKCNILMTNFVRKNLKNSHGALVARLVVKAQLYEAASVNDRLSDRNTMMSSVSAMSSPQLSNLSLSHQASVRSSSNSPGFQQPLGSPTPSFQQIGSPSLVPMPLYQNQDPRNSFFPGQGQYQQGYDPRMSMMSQQQLQPHQDPGYQAYLEHQRQSQMAAGAMQMESHQPQANNFVAEMSTEAPEKKGPPGGPPVHPTTFAAELE
jgi:hypothetical protein